ncbi:MAG: phospho-sugar mutase [Polyangiaceae bacterium]
MDSAELRAEAKRWIEGDPDPVTRAELQELLARPAAAADLADRFAGELEFGTAGLRGVLGAGPNRMNRAVVARATWGLAQEILATVPDAPSRPVIVGGDARRMSRELSEDTATILAAAGLQVLLFRKPVPTPLVGFAVKELRAAAGVVVTASHNPPEYNGYKVYWENSAQIVPPVDGRIAAAIRRAPRAVDVPRGGAGTGAVKDAPASLEEAYIAAVLGLAVHPDEGARDLRIVYTHMHGVGDDLVRRVLDRARFTRVTSVPEQRAPDPAFPTVAFPNPEEKGAMDRAFACARAEGAALVLANDPDADRLAAAIPAEGGGFHQLTGNELGAVLGHYLLTERPATRPRAVLASIVSSPLLGRMAADLGVRYEETLTGFKWIANRSIALEREGFEVVFGFEEALGYSVGGVVRDKDGISAALLAAEVAAVLQARGSSLRGALEAIARRWGVFASSQISVTRKGAEGAAAIEAMMNGLRSSPPARIGTDAVVAVSDYRTGERFDRLRAARTALGMPASNVLTFELASGSRIIARPSGTEPKAKFYFDVREAVAGGESVEDARARARATLSLLSSDLEKLLRA